MLSKHLDDGVLSFNDADFIVDSCRAAFEVNFVVLNRPPKLLVAELRVERDYIWVTMDVYPYFLEDFFH